MPVSQAARTTVALVFLVVIAASGCGSARHQPAGPASGELTLFNDVTVFDDVPAPLDVVARGHTDEMRLVGVYGETLVFLSHGRIMARLIPDESARDVGEVSSPFPAFGGERRDLYAVSADCTVTDLSGASSRVLTRIQPCPGKPAFVQVDATRVYVWFDHGGLSQMPSLPAKQVWSVERAGGRAKRLADVDELVEWAPHQDDEFLYVAPAATHILRLSKRGGALEVFVEIPAAGFPPALVGVDDGFVYWTLGGNSGFQSQLQSWRLQRTASGSGRTEIIGAPSWDGARLTSIVSGDASFYAAAGDSVFLGRKTGGNWRKVGELPRGSSWKLHWIQGQLYAFDGRDLSTFLHVDLAGPRAQRLLHRPDSPIGSLGEYGDSLCFVNRRSIFSLPKTGGDPKLLHEAAEDIDSAPALDADSAYFVAADGSLVRAPLGGGREQVLAPGPAGTKPLVVWIDGHVPLPRTVVADADSVYWLDFDRGALCKVSKRGGPVEVLVSGTFEEPLTIEGETLYFVRTQGDARQVGRVDTRGRGLELLLRGSDPTIAQSAASTFIENDLEVYAPSATGLRALGRLVAPLSESVDGLHDVCAFAPAEEAVFYSPCEHEDGPMLLRRSTADGALRIPLIGHDVAFASEFVSDKKALYFVEIGHRSGKPGRPRRFFCCSIWAVPR